NAPIVPPAQLKNKTDRIRNFSLSQMTTAAGIPVSRQVMMKIRTAGNSNAMALPANLKEKIPPDAAAEITSAKAQRTPVAAPHPASQPPIAREQLAEHISVPVTKSRQRHCAAFRVGTRSRC